MKRHFIFTSGRSGSNYLSNTLNLCPDCVNYGEVLGEWTLPYKLIGKYLCNDSGSDRYLNLVYSSQVFFRAAQIYSVYSHLKSGRSVNYKSSKNITSIGLKDFLVTLERRSGLEYLKNNVGIKIIYLYRKNLLKKFVSGQFMKSSGVSSTYRAMQIQPVNIKIEGMLNSLAVMMNESTREKDFLGSLEGRDILTLEYETYFKSQESILYWNKKVFEFLDITPVSNTSSQKKILPDSLKETVSNSEEVIEALAGTPYERFIY